MSLKPERGWAWRVARALLSALTSGIVAVAAWYAGAFIGSAFGREAGILQAVPAAALAAGFSLAASFYRASPLRIPLSVLSRVSQLLAFALGLGATTVTLRAQQLVLEVDLGPLLAALLVAALVMALVDAYDVFEKSL